MPYVSDAQRRLFHSKGSPVSKETVKEFDRASKGVKLPEKVQNMSRGGAVSDLRFKRVFDRREREEVQNPREPTDLARAAARAEVDRRQPSPSFADLYLRKR
jgi:hypothetical protein